MRVIKKVKAQIRTIAKKLSNKTVNDNIVDKYLHMERENQKLDSLGI